VAVISQRLHYRPDLKIHVPECEILMATYPVRNFIRKGEFFKVMPCLETGADHGMWTFQRYRAWMEKRTNWYIPNSQDHEEPDSEPAEMAASPEKLPPLTAKSKAAPWAASGPETKPVPAAPGKKLIEIEPVEGGLGGIISKLEGE